MSLTDIKDGINFASQIDIDKIVRVYEGSFNAATQTTAHNYTYGGSPNAIQLFEIEHDVERPMFCELLWSTDNTTFYDGGVGQVSTNAGIVFCDSDKVYIYTNKTSGTVYYKVLGSWITDYDDTAVFIEPNSNSNKNVVFDSRLNYQKIYDQGQLDFTAGTFGSSEALSVTHDLEYMPNTKIFIEAFPGQVWPLNFGGASNPFLFDDTQDEAKLAITDELATVTMFRYSNAVKRAWYRIYYDAD